MKVFKANSAKGRELLAKAQNYEGFSLSDVYANYSKTKADAWHKCYSQCTEEEGKCFGINSHNCNFFSVSWFRPDGSLRYETAFNSYLVVR